MVDIRVEKIRLKAVPKALEDMCRHARRLNNDALRMIDLWYRITGEWLPYSRKKGDTRGSLYTLFRGTPDYQAVNAQSAQQALKLAIDNWKRFFEALKAFKADPRKFNGVPRPPKPVNRPLLALFFTEQQVRIERRGDTCWFSLPGRIHRKRVPLLTVQTRLDETNCLKGARVVPRAGQFWLEILHAVDVPVPLTDFHRIAAIDLGAANLVTLVTNIGTKPLVVKGSVLKGMNQFYDKQVAKLTRLYQAQGHRTGSARQRLNRKHYRKVDDYLHQLSRAIVNWCLKHQLDVLVVGYNPGWKHRQRRRRNFVRLAHSRLVELLRYKCADAGIVFVTQREAYTSRCSFLDGEAVRKHRSYCGQRFQRALFRSAAGTVLNADVNAAYNILVLAFPQAFSSRKLSSNLLHPQVIALDQLQSLGR
ncbi:MAG: RNA-guided endonuclease InsQ/TnpB family protein [Candidatus Hermodarchaeota archaeon]